MATRLVDAGHAVTVWNRTRSRAEAIAGAARAAASPADAVARTEAANTLATPDAVRQVVLGPDGVAGALTPGAALIDMSTIGPDYVAELASDLPNGVEPIDVPVLGGVKDAVGDTVTLYFGAAEAAYARQADVLAALGKPIHVGPTGAGQALNLVANSTLAGGS